MALSLLNPLSKIEDALRKIEAFFRVNLRELFCPILEGMQNVLGEDNVKKIVRNITRIAAALPMFTGNTSQILAATLEIVTACGSLLGVGINLHRNMSFFVSMILNFAGLREAPVDMEKVVSSVITEAFKKFQDEQLYRDAFSVEKDFAVSFAFLQPYSKELEKGNVPTASDFSALAANIPVTKGVVFLAVISRKVQQLQREAIAAKTEAVLHDKMNEILHYTELYCRLSTLRTGILLQIFTIASCSDDCKMFASGIDNVIKQAENDDNETLKYLFTTDCVTVASMFDPVRSPFVYNFMKSHNAGRSLYVPEILKKRVAMRSMKSIECHLSLLVRRNVFDFRNEKYARVFDGTPTQNGFFCFIKKENDIYHYLSPYGQKGKYLSVQVHSWLVVQDGVPGAEGEWRVIRRDGNYLLSCRRWPARFLTVHASGCLCVRFGIIDTTAEWLVEHIPRKHTA